MVSDAFILSTYCVLDTVQIAGEKVGSIVHALKELFQVWGVSSNSLFSLVCVCPLCANLCMCECEHAHATAHMWNLGTTSRVHPHFPSRLRQNIFVVLGYRRQAGLKAPGVLHLLSHYVSDYRLVYSTVRGLWRSELRSSSFHGMCFTP